MADKRATRKLIRDSSVVLKALMQEQLRAMAQKLVADVMRNLRRATPAQRVNAAKNVSAKGKPEYRDLMKTALAVMSRDAVKIAKAEVPKSKAKLTEETDSIKLGEFERLSPALQKKVRAQAQLVVDTQAADLEKAIFFQFGSSVDSTDSADLIEADLATAGADFVEGASVEAGAGSIAAQAINTARNAFFFDDDTLEEIEAFQFTNGDPVSPICQDLAGTIFAKDDPEADRYFPPLHFNCKSYLVAILKGNLGNAEIGKLKPSSPGLEKFIQFSEAHASDCPTCGA